MGPINLDVLLSFGWTGRSPDIVKTGEYGVNQRRDGPRWRSKRPMNLDFEISARSRVRASYPSDAFSPQSRSLPRPPTRPPRQSARPGSGPARTRRPAARQQEGNPSRPDLPQERSLAGGSDAALNWQKHSVWGFIAALGKTARIESVSTGQGVRTYKALQAGRQKSHRRLTS